MAIRGMVLKRGISPIFSSIIILVIAVLGSTTVLYFTSQAITTSQPANVFVVENAVVSRGLSGPAEFVCTVKNVGRNPIVRLSVQLADEPEYDFPDVSSLRPLNPGQSASIIISTDPNKYVVGNTYIIKVKAVTSDGSSLAYTTTAPCRGAGGSPTWTPPPAQSQAQGGSGGQSEDGESGGQGGGGGSGGQGGGGGSNVLILFCDGFNDRTLSEWRLWGDTAGYIIAIVNHGRPAPCLYVGGNGPRGARVGAAKTVSVPEGLRSATVAFNYNVMALKDGGLFPGNLWLRIDADGETVFNEKIYDAKSVGSGWKSEEAAITFAKAPRNITVIFYMIDESDKTQEFWLDNIELRVVITP